MNRKILALLLAFAPVQCLFASNSQLDRKPLCGLKEELSYTHSLAVGLGAGTLAGVASFAVLSQCTKSSLNPLYVCASAATLAGTLAAYYSKKWIAQAQEKWGEQQRGHNRLVDWVNHYGSKEATGGSICYETKDKQLTVNTITKDEKEGHSVHEIYHYRYNDHRDYFNSFGSRLWMGNRHVVRELNTELDKLDTMLVRCREKHKIVPSIEKTMFIECNNGQGDF